MKRPPDAPRSDIGRMSADELSKIQQEVAEALELARLRVLREQERSAAAPSGWLCGAGSPEGAAAPASTPASNTGGKLPTGPRLVLEDGEVMEVTARRGYGGSSAFLDWVNFTTDETDYFFGHACVTDDQVIDKISHRLKHIFGFGITETRQGGANFYQKSYVLGDGYGLVCHGGQRDTVLVCLTGKGCEGAKEGWEKRLYDFLKRCGPRAKLTRVDVAHDVYDGVAYSVDRADKDFEIDLFNCGGRTPDIEHRGNWKRPNGKGRTVYIGHRTNGKYARIYEKGRQLGDVNSEWCRVEVEFKSVSRIIPFEILLNPGEYLAAAYPAFSWINVHQERILTTQKSQQITYENMLRWLKRQCGAALAVGTEIEGGAENLLKKIMKPGEIPARLKMPSWRFCEESIHEREKVLIPIDAMIDAAFA